MDTKLLLLSFSLATTFFNTGCKEANEKGQAYSLAQTCVSIKAHDTDQYIIKQICVFLFVFEHVSPLLPPKPRRHA